jgi:uncharacterized protein YciI
MLAIVSLIYKVPLETVLEHVADHRAYCAELHARGHLLASGPYAPRVGGAFLMRAEGEAEVRALLEGDPFKQRGVADYDVKMWVPAIGADALEALSKR